jgi:hypothetical protein
MEYLRGHTIKPNAITTRGEVLFTDGTNLEMRANQVTCEAYGYTYDTASGTCSSFRHNTNLERNINNINNKNNGPGNTTEVGSNTIQINGTENITKGFNNNCFINGRNNEIANGVNNATVLGSNGEALIDGDFVIGSADGISQTSTFFLNGTTGDATATALFINGNTDVTTIARNPETLYFYTIDIHAYNSGTTNRAFFTLRGMNNDYEFNETLTTNAARGTVVGWSASTSYTGGVGSDMTVKVVGAAGTNMIWTATARFNEMKI